MREIRIQRISRQFPPWHLIGIAKGRRDRAGRNGRFFRDFVVGGR